MVIDFKGLRSVKYYYLHLRNGTDPPLVFHGETDRAFSTSRFNGAERSAMERSLGCREMEAERNPIKLSRVKERNGKDFGREGERECVCINLWNNGTERRENERK
jgi:hypothetical protein